MTRPTDPHLSALAHTLREVARNAVMPHFLKTAGNRKSDGSVLTEADLAAQAQLAQRLPKILAGPVLGEEMPQSAQAALWQTGSTGLWCIDPIDGTSNFANGIPFFGLSAAYMENGETRLGAVYNPASDECFLAARGAGAWLNDTPLPLREPAADLAHAIAGVDPKRLPLHLREALAGAAPFDSQRNFGASALEWCFVAAGRLDVYVHGGQMLWDYAAGQLILEEAGGAHTTLEGRPAPVHPGLKRSVVAGTNAALLRAWHGWLRPHLETSPQRTHG